MSDQHPRPWSVDHFHGRGQILDADGKMAVGVVFQPGEIATADLIVAAVNAHSPWISVEERLPDEGETVDVWVRERGRRPNACVYHVNERGIAFWQDAYGNLVGGQGVSHWMPLPAPPAP